MNKIFILLFISLFISSCGKPELKKEEAQNIISSYFQLPSQTKIAIDKRYEDYGWPPEKYKQLSNMGLILLRETNLSHLQKTYEISLREDARKYWMQNGTMQAGEGNKIVIIFKGYFIDIKDVSVLSNAKEDKAEAEIILKISNISPIQEIFGPLESTEVKKSINFKLYDNGWQIVEDENTKRLFQPISAPQHWAGNWNIIYDNTPADIISNEEISNMQQVATDAAKRKIRVDELTKVSKIPTRTIDIFHDVNSFGGLKQNESILTDVDLYIAGSPYNLSRQLWFGEITGKPELSISENTYPSVLFSTGPQSGANIMFKERSECDRFYQTLIKALNEWRAKYNELL
jgi:hypothetical protein